MSIAVKTETDQNHAKRRNSFDRMLTEDPVPEVTPRQKEFLDAWYANDKSYAAAAKAMGVTRQRVREVLMTKRCQWHIAQRDLDMTHHFLGENNFEVNKTDKMKLLWRIAKAGTEKGYDKTGNEVMVNPQVSVQAIAQLNQMQGHNAPTEISITKIEKSEKELEASIRALQDEYNQLLAIEGEVLEDGETRVNSDGEEIDAIEEEDEIVSEGTEESEGIEGEDDREYG